MPETQSQEKKDFLRLIGADLRLVPAVPYKDPGNYQHYSGRLAAELAQTEPNGTTGEEIWAETGGRIDAFTCAPGTGGTIAGVGMALKAHDPHIRIVLADP